MLGNNFSSNLEKIVQQTDPQSQVGQGLVAANLGSRQRNIAALEGSLKLDLNLNVTGNADSIDQNELKKVVRENVSSGMTELFSEIRQRSRNNF